MFRKARGGRVRTALFITGKPFVSRAEDKEAQSFMALAAAAAGVGFGNAGVHLVHGMSYPVAGLNETYKHPGYNVDHAIV